ncbi:MAG: galactose mutarotase [Prevotella sp.]|nr:galactose mutarotase [Prevotella sp.]
MKHILPIWMLLLFVFSLPIEAQLTRSGLDPARFNEQIDGRQTALYTLTNANGTEACITNYGARLVSLMVPNWNGRFEDVVLGYDNVMDYHTKGQNFGAIVGRYVGRIKGPRFTIDGQEYRLQDDGKGHISHGGRPSFANRVWDVLRVSANRIILQYVSPDGENGFPGELKVKLTYTLTDQNSLDLSFEATTTKTTVLNLTNHSFFNISGDLTRPVLPQHLWIDSRQIATYDAQKNVDGRLMKVKRTPFNFTKPRQIGDRINADDAQLNVTGGYDHAFLLRHPGNLRKPAAILYDAQSGRTLTVYTTEPAIQVYTGNGLKGNQTGKNGTKYARRTAICLETMHLSDSPNRPQFPSTVLRPGQTYRSKTVFKFTTDPPLMMKSAARE